MTLLSTQVGEKSPTILTGLGSTVQKKEFYQRAFEDCRMIYARVASPQTIQTLVQVWKQLWKWRGARGLGPALRRLARALSERRHRPCRNLDRGYPVSRRSEGKPKSMGESE
jgi:hypothetical protein